MPHPYRAIPFSALALTLLSAPALAETVIYDSQAIFQSHLASPETDIPVPVVPSNHQYPTYTLGDFQFQRGANSGYFFSRSPDYNTPSYLEYFTNKGTSVETIDIAGSHSALGLVFGDSGINVDETYAIDINGVFSGSVTVPGTSSTTFATQFLGITSDTGISQIRLVTDSIYTDTVGLVEGVYDPSTGTTGAIVPTPEPSPLALLGTGLVGVIGTLRRRLR